MGLQNGFRWCGKCEGLYFSQNPTQGVCPGGGAHDPSRSGPYGLFFGEAVPGAQDQWHFCQKCQGIFFSGNPTPGVCPAGGGHDGSTSGNYFVPVGDTIPGTQGQWRFCQKCQGMFFSGNPTPGVCPAGGGHDASASGAYGVPLETIALSSGPIVFGGGVPVGGWSNLSLHADGSFLFSGSFRDSGAPTYKESILWAVKAANGTVLLFSNQVETGGILDGPREVLWNKPGNNPAIATHWNDLTAGYSYTCQSRADMDLQGLWDSAKSVIGTVGEVVAVVGPLLA
jgi:hypothetical protein